MALREIGEDGSVYEVLSLSHKRDFDRVWLSIPVSERTAIEDEIKRRLDALIASPDPNWGSITNTSIEGGRTNPNTGIRGDWRGTVFQPIYVFTAPRGGFIQNLKRYWYPALRRAGIEDFHFHDLRHTFASRAAMSGVDLYTLQALMRHRSSLMTQRYAHLSAAHQREAVRRLDAWHQRQSTVADRF